MQTNEWRIKIVLKPLTLWALIKQMSQEKEYKYKAQRCIKNNQRCLPVHYINLLFTSNSEIVVDEMEIFSLHHQC
jgi:hypothetical protein